MDKTVESLLKAFTHLARELQVYVFGGLIVLANVRLLDIYYFDNDLWDFIASSDYILLMVFISAYIIGHICLAVYIPIECLEWDRKLQEVLFSKLYFGPAKTGRDLNKKISNDIKVFKDKPELFYHYIDRHTNLSLMRWTYSSAFFLSAIANFIFAIYNWDWVIFGAAVFAIFAAFGLFALTLMTQEEALSESPVLKDA